MFWLFIVMVDCAITIGLDSDPYGLLVISDPSDAISTSLRSLLLIFTYHSHFTENNIIPRSLALCKTLYRFDLTHTVFYCIPDLILRTSTLTHCIPPRYTAFFWLSFVLPHVLLVHFNLTRSFVTYIGLHIRTYPHTYTPLSDHYWAGYTPILQSLLHIGHIGTDIPELRTFRSFSFQCYII